MCFVWPSWPAEDMEVIRESTNRVTTGNRRRTQSSFVPPYGVTRHGRCLIPVLQRSNATTSRGPAHLNLRRTVPVRVSTTENKLCAMRSLTSSGSSSLITQFCLLWEWESPFSTATGIQMPETELGMPGGPGLHRPATTMMCIAASEVETGRET